MKVIELQLELKKRLLRACHQHLEFLKSDLSGKTLSSYTFLCCDGFRNIGIASCTTEKIEELKSKNEAYSQLLDEDSNTRVLKLYDDIYEIKNEISSYYVPSNITDSLNIFIAQ